MGVVLSGSFLANAIGSAIGGVAVELVGARWTFGLAVAVMVACAVPVLRRAGRVPE
jgi:hypothetical protein